MCAPNLGEDDYTKMSTADIPRNWPDHLDAAVLTLNNCILPHLKYSPNELLFGLVVNTKPTPENEATTEVNEAETILQMAYTTQQHLDGYSMIIEHATQRKTQFDKNVQDRAPREVVFQEGQLVQVYRSDLDYTFKTNRLQNGAEVVHPKVGCK